MNTKPFIIWLGWVLAYLHGADTLVDLPSLRHPETRIPARWR